MADFINHGVLEGKKETDFIAGSLPYEVRNESGDWSNFAPPGEWQKSSGGDSMACVTFSALNSIEAQEKQLTGKQVNYSDRWIAKMSNTTPQGNYLYAVADAIRKYGLVLESDYPTPEKYIWAQYHADIPESKLLELIVKGKKWLEKWDVAYEWSTIDSSTMKKELKHVPLQVVVPGHAIMEVQNKDTVDRIFDSYSPFFKDKKHFQLSHSFKIVLTPKQMFPIKKVKVVIDNKQSYGLAIITPNMVNITLAEDPAEWISYSQLPGYGASTVNPDGSPNYDVDAVINL